MPLPPPPEAALSITGKPIFVAAATASSVVSQRAPGTMGTPAARHLVARGGLAAHLRASRSAGGPMKTMPAFSHASGSAGFSLRKP